MKYLLMLKLQFVNTTYDVLAKFRIEKICSFHLFNFLTCYKVITYTGDTS